MRMKRAKQLGQNLSGNIGNNKYVKSRETLKSTVSSVIKREQVATK